MKRCLMTLSYEGTNYAGFQRQKNGLAVQEVVESALLALFKTPITLHGASRTDAGVHALCQRAHFDVDTNIPCDKMPFALNYYLPSDVRVTKCQEVDSDFNARFMAQYKTYTYRIYNAPIKSALYRNLTAHVPLTLNEHIMHEAAQSLLGTHDFAAFKSTGGSQKTTVRTIYKASVQREGAFITFKITGNAFLYNMVRILAGSLILMGQNKLSPLAFDKAFLSLNRLDLGATAPACGLELTDLHYEIDDFAII